MKKAYMIEKAIRDAAVIITLLWPFLWFCFNTAGM
jgi:hypothetical protein